MVVVDLDWDLEILVLLVGDQVAAVVLDWDLETLALLAVDQAAVVVQVAVQVDGDQVEVQVGDQVEVQVEAQVEAQVVLEDRLYQNLEVFRLQLQVLSYFAMK